MNGLPVRILLLSFVLITPLLPAAEPLPETSKLLPADTVMYLSIEAFPQFRSDFEKTGLYQAGRSAAMGPFVENLKKKLEEMFRQKDSRLADLILKENVLPEGRVAVAVIQPAKGADGEKTAEEQTLLLIQWGSRGEAVQKAFSEDIQKQLRDGVQRKEESFRGVPVITVIRPGKTISPPSPEEAVTTEPVAFHYAFVKDVLLMGQAKTPLEFAIAHLQGARGETLFESKSSIAALRALGSERPVEFFIDLKRLFVEAFSYAFSTPRDPQTKSDLMGFAGLEALLGVVQPAPGSDVSMQARMLFHCPAPRRGIPKALEPSPGTPALPAFLDPQSSRIIWVNLDPGAAAAELLRSLATAEPTLAASLNSPLIPPESPESGLFTAMDLTRTLTSPILVAEKVTPGADGAQSVAGEPLFVFGVRDKETLSSAVTKLHAHFIEPRWPNSRREYVGFPMYVIPMTSFDGETQEGAVPTSQANQNFAWAITDSYLLAGLEPAVEQALSRISNPTAEKLDRQPWVQQTRRALPGSVGMAALINSRDFGRVFWQSLKDEDSELPGILEIEGLPEEALDFDLLPPFEAVQPYLGPTVYFLQARPEGFFLEIQSLNSPDGR